MEGAAGGQIERPVPQWCPGPVLPIDLRRRLGAGGKGRPVHIVVNAVDSTSVVRMFEKLERGDEW